MVRLEALIDSLLNYVLSYFNSSMVRLEDDLKEYRLSNSLFQFQYGTIRSVTGIRSSIIHIQFQFQYGTIRSSSPSSTTNTVRYFNSSMVRLED